MHNNRFNNFINSQLKFINQAIKGLFDYADKRKNEQSNALDLLSAYLVDGKLNSRQVMIIQHAIKHLGAVYTMSYAKEKCTIIALTMG
jgi:hypothetical protein